MSLPAMCEGWRGRSGGGGPNQTKKPKTKNKIKQKRMKHALLNTTNANSAAESNATTTARCIQKTLTVEMQFFQMRKMNQR
jgi:hypothetical protein